MSELPHAPDRRAAAAASRTRRALLVGAALGLLIGALLTNLGTALVELDESRSLGAACEHAEATIAGAPGGLLVGLTTAAAYLVLRRHRRVALAALGGAAGGFVALLLVGFLLYPLATNHLPVFVCPY